MTEIDLEHFIPIPQEMVARLRILLASEYAILSAVLGDSWRYRREWTSPRTIRDWAEQTGTTSVTCRRAFRVMMKAGVLQRGEQDSSSPEGHRYRLERRAFAGLTDQLLKSYRLQLQARDACAPEQGRLPTLDLSETQVSQRPGSKLRLAPLISAETHPPDLSESRVERVESPLDAAPVEASGQERQSALDRSDTNPRSSPAEGDSCHEGKPLELPCDDPAPAGGEDKAPSLAPRASSALLPEPEIHRRVDGIAAIVHRDIKPDWKKISRVDLKRGKLRALVWKVLAEGPAIHERSPEFLASLLVDGCRAFFQRARSVSTPAAFASEWGRMINPLQRQLEESAAAREVMAARRAETEAMEEDLRSDAWRAQAKERMRLVREALARGGPPPGDPPAGGPPGGGGGPGAPSPIPGGFPKNGAALALPGAVIA